MEGERERNTNSGEMEQNQEAEEEVTAMDIDSIQEQVRKRLSAAEQPKKNTTPTTTTTTTTTTSTRGGDDGNSKRQKFRQFFDDADDSKKLPQQAPGAQVLGFVADVFKGKKGGKWTKALVIIVDEYQAMDSSKSGTEKKDYIDIPHGPNKNGFEVMMAKELKVTAVTRPPWRINLFQSVAMTSFNDKGIVVGEFVWCSGVRYEISGFAPYGSGDKRNGDRGGPIDGDAIPEISCEYLNPIRDAAKMAEVKKLLGKVKIGPVSELAYGNNIAPYPEDIQRLYDPLLCRNQEIRNAMNPFAVPNEMILAHTQMSPFTVVHLSNKMYRTMNSDLPKIEEEEVPGATPCLSKIPGRDNLVRDITNEAKETMKKPVLASAKGSDKNGHYSLTIADVTSERKGAIVGIFWDGEIKKFGVQSYQAWEEYGTQIMRGADALVGVKIDKHECFMDEENNKYYLTADRLTFIQIDYKETFRWIGVGVEFEHAEQVCLRGLYGKQWLTKPKKLSPRWKDITLGANEVALSSKLNADAGDQSVKALCLAEATGEMATLVPPENWLYYLVPPGNMLSEPDPGCYLEELGFYKINQLTGAEKASEIEKVLLSSNIDKWTVFAIRR